MDMVKTLKIPLFPLNAVLFPGGALPLRIFEPRYLDMVSECMKSDTGIGVVLIAEGLEAGAAAKPYEVGTLSTISYWHKRNDGMLGVTLTGEQRFRILSLELMPNQLTMAEVELLSGFSEPEIENNERLVKLLKQIIAQLEPPYTTMTKNYDSLEWVSARLIELLPLELDEKQKLLNMENVDERINYLHPILIAMEMV